MLGIAGERWGIPVPGLTYTRPGPKRTRGHGVLDQDRTSFRRPSRPAVSGRRRSRSSGQSLVEFALVFPILLFLLLTAIDFGRIYLGWVNLQQMVRIAANDAANNATAWQLPDTPAKQAQRDRYQKQVAHDAEQINCVLPDPIPDPVFAFGTSLGAHVSVSIECEFSVITPIVSNVVGGTVLVGAQTVFPIKEGVVSTVPGGGFRSCRQSWRSLPGRRDRVGRHST